MAVASFLLYWRLFASTIASNQQKTHEHFWDLFTNTIGLTHKNRKANQLLHAVSNTGQRLKQISKHPAISATSLDVLFTAISLLAWNFTRNLDIDAILENSILSFLVTKPEKHVAFEDDVKRLVASNTEVEAEEPIETTTPRKRGRPTKNKSTLDGAYASTTGSARRSTGRSARSGDHESDAESVGDTTYQPSKSTMRAVNETEADGATAQDIIEGGESTALGMFLGLLGGLGQLASGTLGAEVTGPRE